MSDALLCQPTQRTGILRPVLSVNECERVCQADTCPLFLWSGISFPKLATESRQQTTSPLLIFPPRDSGIGRLRVDRFDSDLTKTHNRFCTLALTFPQWVSRHTAGQRDGFARAAAISILRQRLQVESYGEGTVSRGARNKRLRARARKSPGSDHKFHAVVPLQGIARNYAPRLAAYFSVRPLLCGWRTSTLQYPLLLPRRC